MNAAPSLSLNTPRPQRSQAMPVPARWRLGQMIVLGIIALMALNYFVISGRVDPRNVAEARSPIDFVGFVILGVLVWMTTPNAGVIASTTLQEAVRRRWLSVLLLLSLVLLACSPLFTGLQPGEEEHLLQDFGMGFIITITLLMTIFLGVALVPPDIERRTIFTILSKPVNRNEFVIGKFLGLCATLALVMLSMTIVYLAAFSLFAIQREGYAGAMQMVPNVHPGLNFTLVNLLHGLVLHFGQLCVMAALAVLLSLIVSQITAIVFCFLAFFGGQASSYWEHLGGEHAAEEGGRGLSSSVQGVVKVVYYLLPRLDRFDVRERLVTDTEVTMNYVWKSWNAGLIYCAILIVVAALVFSDREF